MRVQRGPAHSSRGPLALVEPKPRARVLRPPLDALDGWLPPDGSTSASGSLAAGSSHRSAIVQAMRAALLE